MSAEQELGQFFDLVYGDVEGYVHALSRDSGAFGSVFKPDTPKRDS